MRKQSFKSCVVLLGLMLVSLAGFAQGEKEKLKKQQEALLEEIEEIENLLKETQAKRKESITALQSLESKISQRQQLIRNVNSQVSTIERSIAEKTRTVKSLQADLIQLREDYAKAIRVSYKNMSVNQQLLFVFSAEDFNQAWQRWRYLRKYAQFRENQAELIQQTIDDIERTIAEMEAEKREKEGLVSEEVRQKQFLEEEKEEKNRLVEELKDDEEELRAKAQEKNRAAEALNKELERIIAEEIRLAKERARKEAEAAGKSTDGLTLTPEQRELSSNFVSNKGSLPWPVLRGHISGRFGKHEHPTVKGVYMVNNGVDIRTEENAEVRCLFEGKVVSTVYQPATQNSVIVSHGEYFTVYSNLITVNVNAGDALSTGETIGVAYTRKDEGETHVHLEIWKGSQHVDPALWLAPVN